MVVGKDGRIGIAEGMENSHFMKIPKDILSRLPDSRKADVFFLLTLDHNSLTRFFRQNFWTIYKNAKSPVSPAQDSEASEKFQGIFSTWESSKRPWG